MSARGISPLDRALGPEDVSRRNQLTWAAVALVMVLALFAVLGIIYIKPPGYRTYHATMSESGGLKVGDGVRMAGVVVGKVDSLTLTEDAVELAFSVKDDYHVGDRSSVDVRMLTAVGGLYVAVETAGTAPLTGPIPAERVHLPYLVNDMVPDAKRTVDQVDSVALRDGLEALSDALTGAPGATSETVENLEAVVGALAEQKRQVEDLLEMSNEFIATANDSKELATEVIRAYAVLGPQLIASRAKVDVFAQKTTIVVGLLFDFMSGPYAEKIEPMLFPIKDSAELGRQLGAEIDSMIDSMRAALTQLAALSGPEGKVLVDESGLLVDRPGVCIPVPGVKC